MKFKIAALKEGRFKKEVIIEVPQDSVGKSGATNYEKARFIGVFINVSEEERDKHQKLLAELQDKAEKIEADEDATFEDKNAISKEVEELTISFIQKYFVDFEKHPRYPFPFVDDSDKDITSTSDNIAALLDIRLIREQVSEAYNDEINRYKNKKIKSLMLGNLPR
jgi:hypothetical protein